MQTFPSVKFQKQAGDSSRDKNVLFEFALWDFPFNRLSQDDDSFDNTNVKTQLFLLVF